MKIKNLKLESLVLDTERNVREVENYERFTTELASNWKDSKCDPLLISEQEDGSLLVIQGHIRVGAARRATKPPTHLPCQVLAGLTKAEEASLYFDQGGRYGLSKVETYKGIKSLVESTLETSKGLKQSTLTDKEILDHCLSLVEAECGKFDVAVALPMPSERVSGADSQEYIETTLKAYDLPALDDGEGWTATTAFSSAREKAKASKHARLEMILNIKKGWLRSRVDVATLALNGFTIIEQGYKEILDGVKNGLTQNKLAGGKASVASIAKREASELKEGTLTPDNAPETMAAFQKHLDAFKGNGEKRIKMAGKPQIESALALAKEQELDAETALLEWVLGLSQTCPIES